MKTRRRRQLTYNMMIVACIAIIHLALAIVIVGVSRAARFYLAESAVIITLVLVMLGLFQLVSLLQRPHRRS